MCVLADTGGEFAQPHFPFNEIYHNNFHKTTSYRRKSTRDLSNHTQKLDENFPFFAYTYTEKKLPFGRWNMRLWYTQHFYRIQTDRHTSVRTLEFSFAFSSFFALFYYTIHLDWDLNTLSNYVFMILCVNTNCETHTLFQSSSYRIALTCRKNENSWLIDTNHLVLQTTLKTIRIRGTGRY